MAKSLFIQRAIQCTNKLWAREQESYNFLGIGDAAYFRLERYISVLPEEPTWNPTDNDRCTPLAWAVIAGHVSPMQLLRCTMTPAN